MRRHVAPLFLVALVASAACSPGRGSPTGSADARPHAISARVPAALRLARALDTLNVSADPAALATIEVAAPAGAIVGVETESFVSALGQPRPARGHHRLAHGADFDAAMPAWSTRDDGIPQPGTRYGVEVQLVLFATDVTPSPTWAPHAGRYEVLWTRTLQQAEE